MNICEKYGLSMRSLYPAIFLTFLCHLSVQGQQYQLERVEPLHWWTGMHNPELQVMLYGEHIGELTPEISGSSIKIKKVERVENPNYLFLYLHIAPGAGTGTYEIHLGKNGSREITHSYTLKSRKEGSAEREGFDSSDVIYLITPDRFANGNYQNDTVQDYADTLNRRDDYARHGGDLRGIIDHLDYIEQMGFTAIWLNPVLENAMPEASYHGYATTDYYSVDPRFGSNEHYKKLAQKAEKRGIKLIMDMIMNHSGSKHWWMKDPPSSNWFHHQDQYQITNHRRTTLHDPYAARIDKKRFTDGWFVSAMPDLNQDNPLLADYLIYNSIWWIEYAGLRGIRHDTHPYAGDEFMARWTCRILEEYPDFNIVGEEWSPSPIVLAKWQRGSDLPVDINSCLPSLMDFPLQFSLTRSLTEEENWNSGFINLYETLSYDFLYPDPYNLVIFPDNHDMDRFYRQVGHDYDLFKMGLTYLLTMRGIPQIYYGTEILMSNQKPGDHGEIRADFPGGWSSDSTDAFSGKNLSAKKQRAQEFTKKLLNWRKDNPVIHNGRLMQFAPAHDGLYIYFRYDENRKIMVALNKNDENIPLNDSHYSEMLDGYHTGTDVATGKTYTLRNMQIPRRSALILELE